MAWAPSGQNALANESAIYLYSDVAVGIPNTPLKAKAHIGYANSDSFLGGLDGKVVDYSIGLEATWKALTLGVAFVNTDETKLGGWKKTIGADSTVVFSLGAAF